MGIEIVAPLTALFGAFCGMLITIHVTRYTHTIGARHKFATAFADELAVLKSGKTGNDCSTMFMIRDSSDKHTRAYVEYWSVLNRFDKWRIEKKWNIYQYGKGQNWNKERFIYLVPVKGKTEADLIEIVTQHIESLVS